MVYVYVHIFFQAKGRAKKVARKKKIRNKRETLKVYIPLSFSHVRKGKLFYRGGTAFGKIGAVAVLVGGGDGCVMG